MTSYAVRGVKCRECGATLRMSPYGSLFCKHCNEILLKNVGEHLCRPDILEAMLEEKT